MPHTTPTKAQTASCPYPLEPFRYEDRSRGEDGDGDRRRGHGHRDAGSRAAGSSQKTNAATPRDLPPEQGGHRGGAYGGDERRAGPHAASARATAALEHPQHRREQHGHERRDGRHVEEERRACGGEPRQVQDRDEHRGGERRGAAAPHGQQRRRDQRGGARPPKERVPHGDEAAVRPALVDEQVPDWTIVDQPGRRLRGVTVMSVEVEVPVPHLAVQFTEVGEGVTAREVLCVAHDVDRGRQRDEAEDPEGADGPPGPPRPAVG